MREIQPEDLEFLQKGQLILLTLKTLAPREPLLAADFRDMQAPIFTKTGNFIGFSIDRVLKFGKKPARLINGIWFVDEETNIPKEYEDIIMDPVLLSMELIS